MVFDPAITSVDHMRVAVEKAGYSVGEPPEAALPVAPIAVNASTMQPAAPAEDAHDLPRAWAEEGTRNLVDAALAGRVQTSLYRASR